MTTTNMFQGLGEGKNSSRVLRPPGGGSSNIFGGGDPEPPQQNQRANRNKSSVMDGAAQLDSHQPKAADPAARPVDESAVNPQERQERKAQQGRSDIFNTEPVSQSANKRRGQGAFNPITGEDYPTHDNTPSTKVKQPPGGASSGLW